MYYKHILCHMALALAFFISSAKAQDAVTVMADPSLSLAMSRVAREYSRDFGVTVTASYVSPAIQQDQITEGGAADLLITPSPQWLNELKTQGVVDVYTPAVVAKTPQASYHAAVIAGDNMDAARKLLEYLKSDAAQKIFRDFGL